MIKRSWKSHVERELEFESFMEMVVPVEEIKGRKGRKRNLFYLSL